MTDQQNPEEDESGNSHNINGNGKKNSTTSLNIEIAVSSTPTIEELLSCQFSSWYSIFRNSSSKTKLTPKSIILSLPKSFIDYLLSDGVKLPQCCISKLKYDEEWYDDDNDDDNGSSSSSEEDNNNNYSFPDLTKQIKESIEILGGCVFPKLNFSCPKDACWIMPDKSLKCTEPDDIYLLLKSSDFIVWDILHSGIQQHQDEENSPFHLVLRKWCNLNPSMEFRCFVYNRKLVAISQRNHTIYYPHLHSQKSKLGAKLQSFFHLHVESKFLLPNYIFDCYISFSDEKKIWIIDFNVFNTHTDPLLFTWNELSDVITSNHNDRDIDDDTVVEVRVVTEEEDRKITMDPLSSYRAPVDTVNLACLENGINFEEFRNLCERPSQV